MENLRVGLAHDFSDLRASDKILLAMTNKKHDEQDIAPGATQFSSISATRNEGGKWYLLGFLTYGDVFGGVRHETEFCTSNLGTNPNIWNICPLRNSIK